MKKVITICLVVAILLIAGCGEELLSTRDRNIRMWVASNESTMIRGGYLVDPNTEFGGQISCNDGEPRTIAVYAIRHEPNFIQIPNPFAGVEGWPEIIEGNPYWGARIFRDLDLKTSGFSPLAGIRFEGLFFIEGQLNATEPSAIMAGIQRDF